MIPYFGWFKKCIIITTLNNDLYWEWYPNRIFPWCRRKISIHLWWLCNNKYFFSVTDHLVVWPDFEVKIQIKSEHCLLQKNYCIIGEVINEIKSISNNCSYRSPNLYWSWSLTYFLSYSWYSLQWQCDIFVNFNCFKLFVIIGFNFWRK